MMKVHIHIGYPDQTLVLWIWCLLHVTYPEVTSHFVMPGLDYLSHSTQWLCNGKQHQRYGGYSGDINDTK